MIGWDGGENLVAIEMKRSLTDHVIRQAHQCTGLTDNAYCAVQTYPRKSSIKKCHDLGVGILSVRDGSVYEILPPTMVHGNRASRYRHGSSIRFNRERMEKLFDHLRKRGIGGEGGVPNTKNQGPARDVRDLVAAYRAEHPDADWKELFANVANHYASHQSMRQAQNKLEEWIALRAKKEKQS